MKKKLSSIVSVLALSIMFLGTSAHAEYDGTNMNRVNNTDISTRVNDNNLDRVNNDVRTRNVNTTNDLNDNRDRNNNWAWLGLLGLAGLLGLRRRDKEVRQFRMFLVNKYLFIKNITNINRLFKGDLLFYLNVTYVIHTSTINFVALIRTI